jgi:uncharacterized protein (TIGR03437 family)
LAVLFGSAPVLSAEPVEHYALVLTDPPAAARMASAGAQMASAHAMRPAAIDRVASIRTAQAPVREALRSRGLRVTGAVQTVLNAVFVEAPPSREAELRALPGVQRVQRMRRFKPLLDRAVQLVNAPNAWAVLGGENAGAGVKIAIIDTGIDQTHPGFSSDSSISPPSGFPLCDIPQNCAFTNGKVIVARSYVSVTISGTSVAEDISPRDRSGHGTAVAMIAAGETNTGPAATITGMAPGAWIGNYKVFGSPGITDFATGDSIVLALEDAVNDGMDIAELSLGSPALTGPADTGAICGNPAHIPCDVESEAIENATQAGMLVVVAAGNDADTGSQYLGSSQPDLNTIGSPAVAPSALAVGATTNSHTFVNIVRVSGTDVPQNLQVIPALYGEGPLPESPLTATALDVANLDGTGTACLPLATGSLNGKIALILRGTCFFVDKVTNAQNAGAAGAVIYNNTDSPEELIQMSGLADTQIPAAFILNATGVALKSYLGANASAQITLDLGLTPIDVATFNTITYFSSRGPSITYLLKPEVVAVGTDIYTAAERVDPNGDLYDPSGYTVGSGTSFSTPLAAGAAALVKQKNPSFGPLDLRSALIGTATQDVTENGSQAPVTSMGAGKISAGDAIQTTVTTYPATLSFGALSGASLPAVQQLTVHYWGTSPATLTLMVTGLGQQPSLDKTTLTFNPGGPDQVVTVSLTGSMPVPGIYSGAILIQGGATPVRVPYLYLVGDGSPNDGIDLTGGSAYYWSFYNPVGDSVFLAFKVVDQYGVAVQELQVTWRVSPANFLNGIVAGGSITNKDQTTDQHGVATAEVTLGRTAGIQEYSATACAGLRNCVTIYFDGLALAVPTINTAGTVNAASFQVGAGIVPGSYISIFGASFADTPQWASTVPLPLAISQTSVGFAAGGQSWPGAMLYVDPAQVNVQVPWELEGQTAAQITVDVGGAFSAPQTVAVAPVSPAMYVTGQLLAAALDENNNLITASNPIQRNHVAQVFVNGLGAVTNQPATGWPALNNPLSLTVATATATIGGVNAPVEFNGLAPGFPGLDQVNVRIPQNTPTGTQPLIITTNGVSSPAVNIAVQ